MGHEEMGPRIGVSLVDPWIVIEGTTRSSVIAAGDRLVELRRLRAGFFVIDKGDRDFAAIFPSGINYGT